METKNNQNKESVFHRGEIKQADKFNDQIVLRVYPINEKYSFESGILYDELSRVYHLTPSDKSIIFSLIQLHRFNVGSFKYENRKDNLLDKNKRKLVPETLNPDYLEKLGLGRDYFNEEIFTLDNFDNFFKKFIASKDERVLIDDVLYKRKTSFNISKGGYQKYLVKILNLTFDIALEKSAKSYEKIKTRFIGKKIIGDDELVKLNKIKKKFLDFFEVQNQVYEIDDLQILNCIDEFLISIKDQLQSAFETSLERTRTGARKNLFTQLSKHLLNFSEKTMFEKVQTLTHIFDSITDEKELFIYLSRMTEKFYHGIFGRFCRVVLSQLIKEEKLSRPEIRLFILLNIPLKILNKYSVREPLFQDFIRIPTVMNKLLDYMIFRRRNPDELKEYEDLFFSYLRAYNILVTILRHCEREKKQKSRSREVLTEDVNDIESEYEENVDKSDSSKSTGKKNHSQDEEEDEDEGLFELDKDQKKDDIEIVPPENYDEDSITRRPTSKNERDPFKKERSIKLIELDDIIDSKGLSKIEKEIIYLLVEGVAEEYVGKLLDPPISKQAVSKRIKNIGRKFEPKDAARLLLLQT